MTLTPLPIDSQIPAILAALEAATRLVLSADPGAGKTTRVPPALLDAAWARGREIWVLEPRRLAARLSAQRVAQEQGGEVGGVVGYQFRFEKALSAATRLRFITEGLLLRLAQDDPLLSKVACVVLDEFHERSLQTDLGLAFLRQLQARHRPDLRLLIMSATMDSAALAGALAPCAALHCPGRRFEVRERFLPCEEEPRLERKVRRAAEALLKDGLLRPGEAALCFLPGRREIEAAARELAGLPGLEVRKLYGELPGAEQAAALAEGPLARIILSTNIAETSVTVPGVSAVIDSGLARQARASAWSGLSSLVTTPISQASAAQRAGRAGRLRDGVCLRLYPRHDLEHRPRFDAPEVARAEWSQPLLEILRLGLDADRLPWLEAPPAAGLAAARGLLKALGALDAEGGLGPLGRRMARWPLHPRLARFMEAAAARQVAPSLAARVAVLLNDDKAGPVDLAARLKAFEPQGLGRQLLRTLERMLPEPKARPEAMALEHCLLEAFPDRVAQARALDASQSRARDSFSRELLLCQGGSAVVDAADLPAGGPCCLVLDAAELGVSQRRSRSEQARARLLAGLDEGWLLDQPAFLREVDAVSFDARLERVTGASELRYGQLLLSTSVMRRETLLKDPAAGAELIKAARAAGPAAFCDKERYQALRGRWSFLARSCPELGLPAWDEALVGQALDALAQGRLGLGEMREEGLLHRLTSLAGQAWAQADRLAPESLRLPSGRRLSIHYEEGKAPWAASRLQDFLGMNASPSLAKGRVALVLHLLAPNQRPVQVSDDLASFWLNHYPKLRQQLMRRYPKHQWPENPLNTFN